jgi:hypothetical protein
MKFILALLSALTLICTLGRAQTYTVLVNPEQNGYISDDGTDVDVPAYTGSAPLADVHIIVDGEVIDWNWYLLNWSTHDAYANESMGVVCWWEHAALANEPPYAFCAPGYSVGTCVYLVPAGGQVDGEAACCNSSVEVQYGGFAPLSLWSVQDGSQPGTHRIRLHPQWLEATSHGFRNLPHEAGARGTWRLPSFGIMYVPAT